MKCPRRAGLRVDLSLSPHCAESRWTRRAVWAAHPSAVHIPVPHIRLLGGPQPGLCPQMHPCGRHWAPGGVASGPRGTGQLRLGWRHSPAPQGSPRGRPRSAHPPSPQPAQLSVRPLVSGGTEARAPLSQAGSERNVLEPTAALVGMSPLHPQQAQVDWPAWGPRRRLHVPPPLRLPSPPARLWWLQTTRRGRGWAGGSGRTADPPKPGHRWGEVVGCVVSGQ